MINIKIITAAFIVGVVSIFTVAGYTMPWEKSGSSSNEVSAETAAADVSKCKWKRSICGWFNSYYYGIWNLCAVRRID